MLPAPPPVHPPFIGCSSSHQLPQLGSLQHIPCSGSDAEITPSHLQGCQLLSQASICLGGNTEAQQEEGTKSGEPRRQAGGHSATHHEIHGPLLATSSSAPRHLPDPITPRPRHTGAPESGDDVVRGLPGHQDPTKSRRPPRESRRGELDDRVTSPKAVGTTRKAAASISRRPGNCTAFVAELQRVSHTTRLFTTFSAIRAHWRPRIRASRRHRRGTCSGAGEGSEKANGDFEAHARRRTTT